MANEDAVCSVDDEFNFCKMGYDPIWIQFHVGVLMLAIVKPQMIRIGRCPNDEESRSIFLAVAEVMLTLLCREADLRHHKTPSVYVKCETLRRYMK